MSEWVWQGCHTLLQLAENSVEHPVHWSCANTCASACADALQMFYHALDDRQLHIRRIGNGDAGSTLACNQDDRLIGEHGERKRTLVTDNLDAVFLGTLVAYEAPRATARQSVLEEEARADSVLSLI